MMECRNSPRSHTYKLSIDALHESHPLSPTTSLCPDDSTSSRTNYETMNPVSFSSNLIDFVGEGTMFLCDEMCSAMTDELTQPCSRSALLLHNTTSLTSTRYELHSDDL